MDFIKEYTNDGISDNPWLTWVHYFDAKDYSLPTSNVIRGNSKVGDHIYEAIGMKILSLLTDNIMINSNMTTASYSSGQKRQYNFLTEQINEIPKT